MVAAVSPAFASFELVMVADNGAGSFGTRKIHRFDGDTGVYLGSFGGFGSDIIGTHISQATNTLYVMTSDGRTAEYDYNTGALKAGYVNGMFTVSTFAAVRPSGDVALSLFGVNPWTQAFPRVTNWIANLGSLPGSLNFNSGGWLNDRDLFVYDSAQGRVAQFRVAENGQFGILQGSVAANSGYATSQMTAISDSLVVHPVTGQINFYTFGTWGFVGTTSTQNRHSARAHDGFFTMGLRGSTWSLDKYDGSFGQRGQWGSGIVMNPASMQSVVAPEPGTMAALGLGVAALARLRRRKR